MFHYQISLKLFNYLQIIFLVFLLINYTNESQFSNVVSINNINVKLSSWTIDHIAIYDLLNNVDIRTDTGPYGIPSVFLKFCGLLLIRPLHFMINKS